MASAVAEGVLLLVPQIEPLTFSTYLYGAGSERGGTLAVDPSGSVYIVGGTNSSDFPVTANAFDREFSDYEGFLVKMDSRGSSLEWATYVGGVGYDYAAAVAVDARGAVYIAGRTNSTDFPTTPGAFDRELNGTDIFVAEVSSTGDQLVFSTLIGGDSNPAYEGGGQDSIASLAVDPLGRVILLGMTTSPNFPGADTQPPVRISDPRVFVLRLNASGSSVDYVRFLGGNGYVGEVGEGTPALTVDASGAAYVIGTSLGEWIPATAGAFDTTSEGGFVAFVAKIDSQGGLVYTTYLGADFAYTRGMSVAVDSSGAAYVTGIATRGFPTTPGAFQERYQGRCSSRTGECTPEVFVAKLSPDGSALEFGTYLGPGEGRSIALSRDLRTYVSGTTESDSFPTTFGTGVHEPRGVDIFVLTLNSEGSGVLHSRLVGGSSSDDALAVALDPEGNAHVLGESYSDDFPTTTAGYRNRRQTSCSNLYHQCSEGAVVVFKTGVPQGMLYSTHSSLVVLFLALPIATVLLSVFWIRRNRRRHDSGLREVRAEQSESPRRASPP